MSNDLIATARRLAKASPKRPRQSDLKRGVSTAYYALFHCLARECADLLVGAGDSRSDAAWVQMYRALEHGISRNACKVTATKSFPNGILSVADTFVAMQEERHRADYDPLARFARPDVLVLIDNCEQAIKDLLAAPRSDRKAFAVWVLFQRKR
ncbi:hypothetical protein [Rhizobium sp. NXC24]|uniref:hypothetical protein n=1 Tax=Rhizobium sp. NXC24 TaxID=2048897 RepID=UPI000CDF43D3|nr:hypothetical protein [Rhizobium sp. NXC24]AVA25808.1 hypothetical protein NXC24_PC01374 [Rhizobium sp. NXC24]